MGAISSGKVALDGANLLIHSSNMASVNAWRTCMRSNRKTQWSLNSTHPPQWCSKLNHMQEVSVAPQRWGRWQQNGPKRWFHSGRSEPGCGGYWRIHPVLRLVSQSLPEHFCQFKSYFFRNHIQMLELDWSLSRYLVHLKLKEELVKYGGLSKSLIPRQLLTSLMLGRETFSASMMPLWMKPSLVPLQRVTRRL